MTARFRGTESADYPVVPEGLGFPHTDIPGRLLALVSPSRKHRCKKAKGITRVKSNIVTTSRFGNVGGRVQSSRPGLSRFGRKHFRTSGGLIDVERIHIAVAEDNPSDVSWLKTILDETGS